MFVQIHGKKMRRENGFKRVFTKISLEISTVI